MAYSFNVKNATQDEEGKDGNHDKMNLVVLDVYTEDSVPTKYLYEQTVNRIDASPSDPAIQSGSNRTIQFPEQHKNGDETMPYIFIFAVAETLAPIYVQKVTIDEVSNLQDITIDNTHVEHMKRVFNFVKDIAAFPTSDLAVNFTTVLQNGDDAAISTFFSNTKEYKDVTIDDVMLVQSYYSAFPYGWTNGRNTKFYLYSKDYKFDTDTDEPVAHLKITNDWSKPALTTVNTETFKMELTTYDNDKTSSLIYATGTFWDDIQKDVPLVALKGSFIVPSQFTMENSRNEIEPYVIGNMNGFSVFGLDEKAPHEPEGDGGFASVFAVHNFKEGLDLALYFVGIGTAIAFFVGLYYGIKYVKNKFRSDDTLETQKKADEVKEAIKASAEKILKNVVRQVEQNDYLGNVNEIQGAAKTLATNKRLRVAKTNMQDAIDSLTDSITALGSNHVDAGMQNILDAFTPIQTQLANGSLEDIAVLIDLDTSDQLQQYNTQINARKTAVAERMTNEQKKAFKEAQDAYGEVMEVERFIEEQLNELAEGNDAEDVVPHDPDVIPEAHGE